MNLENRLRKIEKSRNITNNCICAEHEKDYEWHTIVCGELVKVEYPIPDKCDKCGKNREKRIIEICYEEQGNV